MLNLNSVRDFFNNLFELIVDASERVWNYLTALEIASLDSILPLVFISFAIAVIVSWNKGALLRWTSAVVIWVVNSLKWVWIPLYILFAILYLCVHQNWFGLL